jgi:cysteine-S-conjugate beta-lyase
VRQDLTVPAFDVSDIRLDDLRRRRSAKWQYYPADVLPAWVAEMDFPLAAPIARTLREAIDLSDTGYQWPAELRPACADFARDSWGWMFDPTRVTVLPDVLDAISHCLAHLTAPGDGVVITPPVYTPFFHVVANAGRNVVEVPLIRESDGRYTLDETGLATAFARDDVTAFLMSHPHNPTGTVLTAEHLATVAGLVDRHGVAVISDEIHAPLVLPGATHVPYLVVAGDDANAVSLLSASKAWNLAGLKAAQVVATARTATTVTDRIPLEATFTSGHFGVLAATSAYREGGPWLRTVVDVLDANRRLLGDLLAERLPLAGYVVPDASFLAWIDLGAYALGADPSAVLLDRGRVGLNAGPSFGTGGDGFVRLNFATSPAILAEIVDRMASVVQ